jgi:hypothetical protein
LLLGLKYRSKPKKTRAAKENPNPAALAYEPRPIEKVFESRSKLASKKIAVIK